MHNKTEKVSLTMQFIYNKDGESLEAIVKESFINFVKIAVSGN